MVSAGLVVKLIVKDETKNEVAEFLSATDH